MPQGREKVGGKKRLIGSNCVCGEIDHKDRPDQNGLILAAAQDLRIGGLGNGKDMGRCLGKVRPVDLRGLIVVEAHTGKGIQGQEDRLDVCLGYQTV